MSVCIVSIDSMWNKKVQLKSKVDDYITLNRFVKYNAMLNGKKTKVLIDTNKLKVVEEDNFTGNTAEIFTLQSKVNELNDETLFESGDFINKNIVTIVTYYPDGSIEKEGTVGIKIEDEEDETWVTINEWDKVTTSSHYNTNNIDNYEE